jgi:hypothetical protein
MLRGTAVRVAESDYCEGAETVPIEASETGAAGVQVVARGIDDVNAITAF